MRAAPRSRGCGRSGLSLGLGGEGGAAMRLRGDAAGEEGEMGGGGTTARGPLRRQMLEIVEHTRFQRAIIALIVVNAIILGLETSHVVMGAVGRWLIAVDRVILVVFVVEICARLVAHGLRFFRDPWSVFDFLVVMIALIPASEAFAVLRALRVLRVLRLISTVPRMRRVVGALLSAIPGLGAIVALLALIFYVAAVMATNLFGHTFPDWFGSLPRSVYSLFQIMTLESWSMGIVRPVMEVHPYAWAFFVPFILIATFTMLNLFIAVVVNAMQSEHEEDRAQAAAAMQEIVEAEHAVLIAEIRALRADLGRLEARIGSRRDAADGG
jgi:voltage-gated sodium channel